MIADDEEMIRNGLKNSINWESLGIDSVFTACNGIEAESLFQLHKPNVILTDIRMPHFSGLELLKRIKESGSEAKVILFSGYDDFSYVQTALKLGAFDYVLKSSDINEFESVIKRALKTIKQEEDEKDKIIRINDQLKASIPLLKDNFLNQMVENRLIPENLHNQFELADITFEAGSLLLIAIEIIAEAVNSKISKCIRDMLESITCSSGLCFISRSHGNIVAIIPCGSHNDEHDSLEKAISIAQHLKSEVSDIMNISLRIGISNIGEGLTQVTRCYKEARTALDYGFFSEKEIVCFRDLRLPHMPDFQITMEIERELSFFIRTGSYKQILNTVEYVFDQIKVRGDIDRQKFSKTCTDLLKILSKEFSDPSDTTEAINTGITLFENVTNLVSFEHAKKQVLEIFISSADILTKSQNFKAKKSVEIVKKYISDHLQEDISLNLLAGIVHISPNYLSSQFHDQTGISLQEYIVQQRIEKAKLMLVEKESRVSDVGQEIGYTNPFYFSRIFKKYAGLSPLDYKKQMLIQSEKQRGISQFRGEGQ